MDQATVSGTRFLTTVIVGRACGADGLGVYALGFSVVVFLIVLQESLITTPYIVLGSSQRDPGRKRHAGSVLVHHGVLGLFSAAGLGMFGAALWAGPGPAGLARVMLVLAAVMPFALLREFARRVAFAHLHVRVALLVDAAVAAVQLGALVALAAAGRLSAATAFAALGLACAVTGVVWLVAARGNFVLRPRQVAPQLARNWAFGKWLCASQLVAVLAGASIYWLLSILISTTATGVYAACWTVVLLTNPFILGLGNVVEPKTARAFATGGPTELRRVVSKVTLVYGVVLSAFWVAVFFLGETIVALLYDDPAFAGHGHTITVLATSVLAAALGIGFGHGLKAIGRPEWNFHASLTELGVMLVVAVPLAWSLGMVGGAYCLLSGSVAGTLARSWAFCRLADGKETQRP